MSKFTLFFILFSVLSFSQNQTSKWNASTKSYERYDSSGNLIGYEKYNATLKQWEYYEVNRTNKYENYNKEIDDFYNELDNEQNKKIEELKKIRSATSYSTDRYELTQWKNNYLRGKRESEEKGINSTKMNIEITDVNIKIIKLETYLNKNNSSKYLPIINQFKKSLDEISRKYKNKPKKFDEFMSLIFKLRDEIINTEFDIQYNL
jgi:peptidoglycan hydrolase CwlO-like protein